MTDPFSEISKSLDHIKEEMEYLKQNQVLIGFFGEDGSGKDDSQIITIVRANEYGTHIVPHNGSGRLWIPSRNAIKKYGKTVKPKDVPGLFKSPTGNSAGINEGGKYVLYFYLLKQVTIPARPFIRKAFLDNRDKYRKLVKAGIDKIVYEDGTGKQLLSQLGSVGVSDIRQSMRRWTKPGNAPLTIDNKMGQDNPLVDTGQLIKHATYKIMPIGGVET
ncbi:hypothetical protein [Lactobacillus amylolyticus]|uniref:hypothetical protein n=1 Tax=Lactobacillus amylolyticus TaxID=83683 RepID=UPI00248F6F54|nr:hypothetical protein [Lactobacillus amylolyticus]